ncbi:molybdate ABC transporter substrate-binding protein [Halobacillus andaensis]|uniref:Molybdate ABC transporter substrate-binding protein n=1 Tax=Halobacillus andaensis TaxID=1176239 RepID=A0A917B1I1_HALAA|nr:molybdate ABC transporter substrate-binding protein [Halobacillus andaensis]MBP2005023.1 molybdate transport system substrate-binding protein [Halobacillus andaensis]GGF17135.1 molybdate ABC transporter substrate-binding protein [Halobacillus andaensis]
MYTKIIVICFIPLLIFTGCQQSEGQEVELTISTAASLIDVMEEIAEDYEKEHSVSITLNAGSSGKIAQQIQQGAPVDAIISADEQWTNRLAEGEHIHTDTQQAIVENTLVLIASEGNNKSIEHLAQLSIKDDASIVIGDPDSVPAGKYARQSLQQAGIWEDIEDHLVYANDARQVLTYVESNNADFGLVYTSDAMVSEQVKVINEVGANTHDTIVYPAAVTSQSTNPDEAEAFLDSLQSEETQEIFKSYGFKLEQE